MRCTHAILLPLVLLGTLLTAAAGQTPIATRLSTTAGGYFGRTLRAVGDADGDGTQDFVVTEPSSNTSIGGRAYLFSGATRGLLATFQGQIAQPYTWGLGERDASPVGDVDGDGRTDFAIGYVNRGALDVFSGRTGARLYRLGTALEYLQYACTIGDYDGDGRADFAALVYVNSNIQLWLVRGISGTQLATVATTAADGRLRNVGDLTGDGFDEIAIASGNTCDLYNLHPPGLLRRITSGGQGSALGVEFTDWNGDGRTDVLFQHSANGGYPYLWIYSGSNGALLRSAMLPGDLNDARGMTVLGDVDGDGTKDLAVLVDTDPIHAGTDGHVAYLSGRTGQRLGDWPCTPQFPLGNAVAGLGDVDADGFPDFVLANAWLGTGGGWQVLSGRPFAGMVTKPVNCYSGPFPPELGMTRPALGSTVTIAGRDAPAPNACVLVFSLMPPRRVNLGYAGCDAWFDPANGVILAQPAAAPSWQVTVPLPPARQLVGVEIALQAFYVGASTPLGIDLTNGLWGRLGY